MEQTLLHKDYRPQSIFKTPQTQILKARYPVIDMHMHAPRRGNLETAATELLENMDECGIETTILFCGIGERFNELAAVFGKYPKCIQLWCGLDFRGSVPSSIIAELERCVRLGANGVSEISDKGTGLRGASPPMYFDLIGFDSLRDDPRYGQFLRKLNLPEEAITRLLAVQR